jgi:Restriction endonuclease
MVRPRSSRSSLMGGLPPLELPPEGSFLLLLRGSRRCGFCFEISLFRNSVPGPSSDDFFLGPHSRPSDLAVSYPVVRPAGEAPVSNRRLGEELPGRLKGQGRPTNTADPVTSERVDTLPSHLFEALIACLLEDQGHRTILTARSNDHGADILSFREGEVWIVQVKHAAREILVGSVAMSDLMAARMSYSMPLSYSVRLMAITNGNFSTETQKEALQHGIRLLDRRELMSQIRSLHARVR